MTVIPFRLAGKYLPANDPQAAWRHACAAFLDACFHEASTKEIQRCADDMARAKEHLAKAGWMVSE